MAEIPTVAGRQHTIGNEALILATFVIRLNLPPLGATSVHLHRTCVLCDPLRMQRVRLREHA